MVMTLLLMLIAVNQPLIDRIQAIHTEVQKAKETIE